RCGGGAAARCWPRGGWWILGFSTGLGLGLGLGFQQGTDELGQGWKAECVCVCVYVCVCVCVCVSPVHTDGTQVEDGGCAEHNIHTHQNITDKHSQCAHHI